MKMQMMEAERTLIWNDLDTLVIEESFLQSLAQATNTYKILDYANVNPPLRQ